MNVLCCWQERPEKAGGRLLGGTVTEPASWPPFLLSWAVVLVTVGVLWRTVRYLLQFPIWGDEAFVCLNFLDRDYLGLLQPLRYHQVAPILFLWSELAVYHTLGGAELSLRLLPFLAGLGSLILFWRCARESVSPLAGLFALGVLAISYYPTRHSCEIKPYAFDLFMSLALLAPAIAWLRQPDHYGPLLLLAGAAPLAVMSSYPAVFVAGAVSLALLPGIWRQRSRKAWLFYLAFSVSLASAFLVTYTSVGRGQFVSTGGARNAYWEEWFPPAQPWALTKWLLATHAGNMMAYPMGTRNGGSTLTLLLVLMGAWQLWGGRRYAVLSLLLLPFALTFVAAAIHRYPYGGSARVAQHLAPAICLLAGTGLAAFVMRVAHALEARQYLTVAVCGLLAAGGAFGIFRDVRQPYKTEGDLRVRQIVADLASRACLNDQIVVLDHPSDIGPTFEWYLRRLGQRVAWDGRIDWPRLRTTTGQLWLLHFSPDGSIDPRLAARLTCGKRAFALDDHKAHILKLGWNSPENIQYCQVFHWKEKEKVTSKR